MGLLLLWPNFTTAKVRLWVVGICVYSNATTATEPSTLERSAASATYDCRLFLDVEHCDE